MCVSRDLCDEVAVNFLYCNSKGGRKRLVRALLGVPRGALQLLPYYARVAATISQAYPEVGQGAGSLLCSLPHACTPVRRSVCQRTHSLTRTRPCAARDAACCPMFGMHTHITGVVSGVEAEFDALAAKKDLTKAGEEPRLRVAR
jgi:hypothetical protein